MQSRLTFRIACRNYPMCAVSVMIDARGIDLISEQMPGMNCTQQIVKHMDRRQGMIAAS
jgi:hypothetical protein